MTTAAPMVLQGVDVPSGAIDQRAFFSLTRRKRHSQKTRTFAGLGNTDVVEIRKSDILSAIHVRFSGQLAFVHSAGNVTATFRWPYDLIRALRFTANGQTNLVNVSGLWLKAREICANPEADDRGIAQNVSGSTVTQGTLSIGSESWGVGPGQVIAATQTVNVELYWRVPVAEDETDLAGAIFAQTSTTALDLEVDWNLASALFVTTGGDTVTLSGTFVCEPEKYSIPVIDGTMVLPDLSMFHSLVQNTDNGVTQGDSDVKLTGQGEGKTLLRLLFRTWVGASPQTLLPMSAASYGTLGWRYGTNETPETYADGRSLRQYNEELYGSDIGGVWGIGVHEFASTWAFRDSIDMGQTSELRMLLNLVNAPTSPLVEYVQETMFSAVA